MTFTEIPKAALLLIDSLEITWTVMEIIQKINPIHTNIWTSVPLLRYSPSMRIPQDIRKNMTMKTCSVLATLNIMSFCLNIDAINVSDLVNSIIAQTKVTIHTKAQPILSGMQKQHLKGYPRQSTGVGHPASQSILS
ncbi:unnamed protein product [Chrysodeixis includens]|uniref:Uncharacterized protein n=1 Tax=Chrysodeixis includens TaxID=689277 RepID=A0A9N8L077_CHRIL|nr:unnamed protein product [Chrysodeixis includens]